MTTELIDFPGDPEGLCVVHGISFLVASGLREWAKHTAYVNIDWRRDMHVHTYFVFVPLYTPVDLTTSRRERRINGKATTHWSIRLNRTHQVTGWGRTAYT